MEHLFHLTPALNSTRVPSHVGEYCFWCDMSEYQDVLSGGPVRGLIRVSCQGVLSGGPVRNPLRGSSQGVLSRRVIRGPGLIRESYQGAHQGVLSRSDIRDPMSESDQGIL